MIDHLALQVADVQAARDFYVTVLSPLGIREAMRYERSDGIVVGLAGPDGFPKFWLGPADGSVGRGPRRLHRTRPRRGTCGSRRGRR